ncbi:MAG: phage terminase small subunit-related protein [Bacillota bacterium]
MARERNPERDKAKQMWLESGGTTIRTHCLIGVKSSKKPRNSDLSGAAISAALKICPIYRWSSESRQLNSGRASAQLRRSLMLCWSD